MSSLFDARRFPASNVIDGNTATLCASTQSRNAWVSVRVAPSSPIGYIAVWNRNDYAQYSRWLSPYELWVGSSPGDVSSSAVRCGGGEIEVAATQGPFVAACPPGTAGQYVTLRLVGWRRYLTIAELVPYAPSQMGAGAVGVVGTSSDSGKGEQVDSSAGTGAEAGGPKPADGLPAANYALLEEGLPEAPVPQSLDEAISLGLTANEASGGCASHDGGGSDHDHGAIYALIVLAACNLVAVAFVAWRMHARRVPIREIEKQPASMAAVSATVGKGGQAEPEDTDDDKNRQISHTRRNSAGHV